MVKNVIKNIVLEKLNARGISVIEEHLDALPLKEIGFDSLDIMEVIIETEGEVRIHVPSKKIHDIYTVNDICSLFENGQN